MTKTLSKIKKDLQEKIVNPYIRRRDSKDGFFICISCGKTLSIDKMNAGHFIPISKSQYLRFHEWNINGECQSCNCFDKSHLIWYEENLIKKIGIDAVNFLKRQVLKHKIYKHSREEIEGIKKYYQQLGQDIQ